MKDFSGIPFASLPEPTAPDFSNRLRNILGAIDAWARDASQGMGRLSTGQAPTGSGDAVFGGGVVRPGSTTTTIQGLSQTDNIQEWRNASGNLVAYIDAAGIFNTAVLNATVPVTLIVRAQMSATTGAFLGHYLSIFSGTDDFSSQVAFIDNTGAASFASLTVAGVPILGTSGAFQDFILLQDTGTGNVGTLQWPGMGSGATLTLPTASGTILSTVNSIQVSNKTFVTSTAILCNTAAGTSFQDASAPTKQMRFDLTGITAANVRAQKWQDTAGSVVTVGNTASASGVLGTIALTAQTGSLTAQTMLTGNASSAGLYRLSFYLKTTTAGDPGDTVKATLSWNDGAAQSMDVPMINATAIVNNLDAGTNNAFVQGSVVVKAAASQNITFTTTLTSPGAGTPAYSIDCRIEALG